MKAVAANRLEFAASIERIALIMRYIVYTIVVGLYLTHQLKGEFLDVIIATAIIGAHNAFSHLILLTRRYQVFLSWTNFLIYLFESTLLIWITGADNSVAYVTYILLIVGLSAFSESYWRILLATFACIAAYNGVLVIEYLREGFSNQLGVVAVQQLSVLMVGWLVAHTGQLLHRARTQLQLQTEALQASEFTLRTILDSTTDPILVFDDRELITEANHRACSFAGLERGLLLRQRFRSFLFDDGTIPNKMEALKRAGRFHGEQVLIGRDGDEMTVEMHIRAVTLEERQHYVTVMHDITERKDLQEATRLANLNLEKINSELQRLNRVKTHVMAQLSQRLRSPLSAILGYVEMMLDEELGEIGPAQQKGLQTCRRSTLRIFRMLDETLDLDIPLALSEPTASSHDTAPETNSATTKEQT